MADVINTFSEAVMDLDSESRFVQNGRFRKAINAAIARAESSNVGTLRNIRGNDTIGGGFAHLINHDVLGFTIDVENDRLYWFVIGSATEGVFELDMSPNFDVPQTQMDEQGNSVANAEYGQPKDIISRILETSRQKKVFNLSYTHLITHAEIREGLLFWTDNFNPPRKIDVNRLRGSGNYYLENEEGNYRPMPLRRTVDGVPTQIEGASVKTNSAEGNAMLISSIDPEFDALGVPLDGITDVEDLEIFDSRRVPVVSTFFPGDLISLAKRPPIHAPRWVEPMDSKPLIDGDFLSTNFVFFAYRWRYQNGEESPLSPWSSAAFHPRRYSITRDPSEFNSMVNGVTECDVFYDPGNDEVTDIELFVSSGLSTPVYSLARINKNASSIPSKNAYQINEQKYRYNSQEVYIALPTSQRNRTYDNVPTRAQTLEFAGSRVVMGNYQKGYPLKLTEYNGPLVNPSMTVALDSRVRSEGSTFPSRSVKTGRDYQVGVVYLDDNGVRSDVIVTETTSISVPFINHVNANELALTINHAAPYWAKYWKPFVRQGADSYYNLFPKNVIRGREDNRLYVQLDSADINKLDAETLVVLKTNSRGIETGVRREYRVNAYGGTGVGFTNSPDLINFNIPFDLAQENTNFGFAPRVDTDRQQVYSAQAEQTTFAVDNFPEGVDYTNSGFKVVSVLLNGQLNTAYNTAEVGGAVQTIVFSSGLSENDSVIVNYTYLAVPIDASAKSDFYLALVPTNEADLGVFAFNDGDPTDDKDTIFETIPKIADATTEVLYFEVPGGKTYRVQNGAHTAIDSRGPTSYDQIQNIYTDVDLEAETIEANERTVGSATDSITVNLDFYNCWSFPLGVEEKTIRGRFNEESLPVGLTAAFEVTTFEAPRITNGLIHSGRFDVTSNTNRYNEFSINEAITTELDTGYGSIQKLHARDTNLVVFCEDKIFHVPINKNIITTTDAGNLTTSGSRYFGTNTSFDGEYGISLNPESFSTYGGKFYWADRNRGVLLSGGTQGGIQEISKKGAEAFFREYTKEFPFIRTAFDDRNDELHVTMRRPFVQKSPHVGLVAISISKQGCPDPVGACNADVTELDFQEAYVTTGDPTAGIQLGDAVYTDRNYSMLHTSPYQWHRISDTTTDPPNNAVIQLTPRGIISGYETDCRLYPPYLVRFDTAISSKTFDTAIQACADGRVDGIAFHDGLNDTISGGETIYEHRDDTVPVYYTGYKLITSPGLTADGVEFLDDNGDIIIEKFVIFVENGVVMDVIDCDVINLGRNSLLGSRPLDLALNTDRAIRNLKLCNLPHAAEIYWFDRDAPLPQLGDLIYNTNFNNILAPGNMFYTYANGYFVRLNSDSKVSLYGRCSEERCFANPTDILYNNFTGNTNNLTFRYRGITTEYVVTSSGYEELVHDAPVPVANAVINYVVTQGNNRFPAAGSRQINYAPTTTTFDYSFVVDRENTFMVNETGEYLTPISLAVGEDITLPNPTESAFDPALPHEVHITQLCYLGVTDNDYFGLEIGSEQLPSVDIEVFSDRAATVPANNNGTVGVPFTLKAIGVDEDGTIEGYSWTLPTGIVLVSGDLFTDTITVMASATGAYQFNIQITDNDLFEAESVKTITVHAEGATPPTVDVVALDPDEVIVGTPTRYQANGTSIMSYLWTVLNDAGQDVAGTFLSTGSVITNEQIEIVTNIRGEYIVRCTVTDSAGLTSSDEVRVNYIDEVTRLGSDVFDTAKAWVRLLGSGDTSLTVCAGSGTTASDDVYSDPNSAPSAWFQSPTLTSTTALAAGTYGFSYVNPETIEESDGGGVITETVVIGAMGIVTSSIAGLSIETVDCSTPNELMLGFSTVGMGRVLRDACFDLTTQVFADQAIGDFSSIQADKITKLNIRNSDGVIVPAPIGFYTNGTVTRFWDQITLADNIAIGCPTVRIANLSVTNNIVNADAQALPVSACPSGTNFAACGSDVENYEGEDYTLTASVSANPTHIFNTPPTYVVQDGEGNEIESGTGQSVELSESFGGENIERVVIFSGAVALRPPGEPPVYRARLNITNNIDNSSVTYSSTTHTVTNGGNFGYIDGLLETANWNITATSSPDNGFRLVQSDTLVSTLTVDQDSVVFSNGWVTAGSLSGDTEVDTERFTLDATVTTSDTTTTSVFPSTNQTSTVDTGETAVLEFELLPSTGHWLKRQPTISNPREFRRELTSDVTIVEEFTGFTAEHFSLRLPTGSTVQSTCNTALTDSGLVYMDAGDPLTGVGDLSASNSIFAGPTGQTLRGDVFIRTSGTSITRWTGDAFDGNTIGITECEVYFPLVLQYHRTAFATACTTTVTTSVFGDADTLDGSTRLFTTAYASTASAADPGQYSDGTNVRRLINGVLSIPSGSMGECTGVFWAPAEPSLTGSGTLTGTLTVLGDNYEAEAYVDVSNFGTTFNASSVDLTFTLGTTPYSVNYNIPVDTTQAPGTWVAPFTATPGVYTWSFNVTTSDVAISGAGIRPRQGGSLGGSCQSWRIRSLHNWPGPKYVYFTYVSCSGNPMSGRAKRGGVGTNGGTSVQVCSLVKPIRTGGGGTHWIKSDSGFCSRPGSGGGGSTSDAPDSHPWSNNNENEFPTVR